MPVWYMNVTRIRRRGGLLSLYTIEDRSYRTEMDWLLIALIVAGLSVFGIVSSIDNAIINADVLATMGEKAHR